VTSDVVAAAGGCHLFSGCGFPAPGLGDFDYKTLFTIGAWHVTKPELLAMLCALIVIVFFWVAFAKPKMIPGKMQSLGEIAVLGVRDQIVRPQLGK
jgi:F-type H+-transporting ATPase subunit a